MEKYPNMLDLNKLKMDFNLTDEAIETCGFSAKDLQEIYSNYLNDRRPKLEDYKNEFLSRFIVSAKEIRLHSYSGRVKDPYHLIEKIIRKRHNNDAKYGAMRVDDYYKYITDLIGCRILLVYKSDWRAVHEYLTGKFQNTPNMYLDSHKYAESYSEEVGEPFMAEGPVVYIRTGDDESLYAAVKDITIKREGYYRSVHYIVRYKEYYVEIQVRSLFEEAWGEVDHDVLYPKYKDDKKLTTFSTLLNRAAGMGDEMSAYFREYAKQGVTLGENKMRDTPSIDASIELTSEETHCIFTDQTDRDEVVESTPTEELNRLLNE